MFGKTQYEQIRLHNIELNKSDSNQAAYLPSRREILLACAKIRASWDKVTERSRRAHFIEWHSLEERYLALYFKEGRKLRSRKKLADCKLCDSDYWQYAISEGVGDE